MKDVQQRQSQLNFYDTGNPYVAKLTLNEVTGGLKPDPVNLFNWLHNQAASAATALFGRPGPIVLAPGFLNQQYNQFTLVHEVLLHAYAGVSDNAVLTSPVFTTPNPTTKGRLWNDGKGSTTISTWMSTDCTCTPGDKNTPTCQPNTAKW